MFMTGIIPTQVWAANEVPGFAVNQLGADMAGNIYRFCKAPAAGWTGLGYVCGILSNGIAQMETTTTSAPGADQGFSCGVAQAAVAANGWGWLMVHGVSEIRVAASCARGTLLNTTATAGQLDDDASAGAEVIDGIALLAARGGSAGNASGLVTWPTIGRTL